MEPMVADEYRECNDGESNDSGWRFGFPMVTAPDLNAARRLPGRGIGAAAVK
jgi:hypothetical protein